MTESIEEIIVIHIFIAALEMDNHQDTYADPDFLKTNQTIHMLLNDISKLRKMIDITANSAE